METKAAGNDIDQRVIAHWHDHHEVLSEALQLGDDLLKELIDAIPFHEAELIHALRQHCA